MNAAIYVDGHPTAAVSARDRGLQFGDGVFETMAVRAGKVSLLTAHLRRLFAGCDTLAITPPDEQLLRTELDEIAAQLRRGVIKLIVTRGSGARGYAPPSPCVPRRIVYCNDWPVLPESVQLRVCRTRLASGGSLSGIKHLNRLEQVLARNEWRPGETADDGLMLDSGDYVIETTHANLFVVRATTLATPSLVRCGVAGVMRETVMSIAAGEGFTCEVTNMDLGDVLSSDELFVTNSIAGITPVIDIGGQRFAIGPVTRRLTGQLADLLQREAQS